MRAWVIAFLLWALLTPAGAEVVRLEKGTAAKQVLALLGKPDSVLGGADGRREIWLYGEVKLWMSYGRLVRVEQNELYAMPSRPEAPERLSLPEEAPSGESVEESKETSPPAPSSIRRAPPSSEPEPPGGDAVTGTWLESYGEARRLSHEHNKPLLIAFFLNSSNPATLETAQRLVSPAFKEYAENRLILLRIGYVAGEETKDAQGRMLTKFQLLRDLDIRGFPCIAVMSPEGRKLGLLYYQPGTTKEFVDRVQHTVLMGRP